MLSYGLSEASTGDPVDILLTNRVLMIPALETYISSPSTTASFSDLFRILQHSADQDVLLKDLPHFHYLHGSLPKILLADLLFFEVASCF